MKITYHSIRPYGSNTKVVEPAKVQVAVFYNDTGIVIHSSIIIIQPWNSAGHAEREAKDIAERFDAASYAILS